MDALIEDVTLEFPVVGIDFRMPKWMRALDADTPVVRTARMLAEQVADDVTKMRDYARHEGEGECADFEPLALAEVKLGEGRIVYEIAPKPDLFWRVLSGECGAEIDSDYALMSHVKSLVHAKREYDRLADALADAERTGYGIVPPSMSDLELAAPEVYKQGSRCGVRLKAKAQSLHIMKVGIDTEVAPIVGTQQQSEDLVQHLTEQFEANPSEIWQTQMFGRPLSALVEEDLNAKLRSLPLDTQEKMRRTLSRILNEGKGGVICILI